MTGVRAMLGTLVGVAIPRRGGDGRLTCGWEPQRAAASGHRTLDSTPPEMRDVPPPSS